MVRALHRYRGGIGIGRSQQVCMIYFRLTLGFPNCITCDFNCNDLLSIYF